MTYWHIWLSMLIMQAFATILNNLPYLDEHVSSSFFSSSRIRCILCGIKRPLEHVLLDNDGKSIELISPFPYIIILCRRDVYFDYVSDWMIALCRVTKSECTFALWSRLSAFCRGCSPADPQTRSRKSKHHLTIRLRSNPRNSASSSNTSTMSGLRILVPVKRVLDYTVCHASPKRTEES